MQQRKQERTMREERTIIKSHQVSLSLQLLQSSSLILFHAVASTNRKKPRPSVRESQVMNGSQPTIQTQQKRHAAGQPPEQCLFSPRVNSVSNIFREHPISTISALLAQQISGIPSVVANRPIPASFNNFSHLSDDRAVQVALNKSDGDHETCQEKQAEARKKQMEKRPPSDHRISSSSDQTRPRKILKPRGPSQRLSVANTLSASKVAPPSPAIVAAPIVPISLHHQPHSG